LSFKMHAKAVKMRAKIKDQQKANNQTGKV
jgi:hypothetical protein